MGSVGVVPGDSSNAVWYESSDDEEQGFLTERVGRWVMALLMLIEHDGYNNEDLGRDGYKSSSGNELSGEEALGVVVWLFS